MQQHPPMNVCFHVHLKTSTKATKSQSKPSKFPALKRVTHVTNLFDFLKCPDNEGSHNNWARHCLEVVGTFNNRDIISTHHLCLNYYFCSSGPRGVREKMAPVIQQCWGMTNVSLLLSVRCMSCTAIHFCHLAVEAYRVVRCVKWNGVFLHRRIKTLFDRGGNVSVTNWPQVLECVVNVMWFGIKKSLMDT